MASIPALDSATSLTEYLNNNRITGRYGLLKMTLERISGGRLNQNFDFDEECIRAIVAALEAISQSNYQIANLKLENRGIDNNGAAILAATIAKDQSIRDLSLVGNNIGDVGAIALAEALKGNNTLWMLNLNGNDISKDGVRALMDAKSARGGGDVKLDTDWEIDRVFSAYQSTNQAGDIVNRDIYDFYAAGLENIAHHAAGLKRGNITTTLPIELFTIIAAIAMRGGQFSKHFEDAQVMNSIDYIPDADELSAIIASKAKADFESTASNSLGPVFNAGLQEKNIGDATVDLDVICKVLTKGIEVNEVTHLEGLDFAEMIALKCDDQFKQVVEISMKIDSLRLDIKGRLEPDSANSLHLEAQHLKKLDQNATTIQSAWRGHKVRSELEEVRLQEGLAVAAERGNVVPRRRQLPATPPEHQAATVIQSAWRNHKMRSELEQEGLAEAGEQSDAAPRRRRLPAIPRGDIAPSSSSSSASVESLSKRTRNGNIQFTEL